MDYSLQGSSVHGIFQASILEWVAISSSGDLPDSGIETVSLASSCRECKMPSSDLPTWDPAGLLLAVS